MKVLLGRVRILDECNIETERAQHFGHKHKRKAHRNNAEIGRQQQTHQNQRADKSKTAVEQLE